MPEKAIILKTAPILFSAQALKYSLLMDFIRDFVLYKCCWPEYIHFVILGVLLAFFLRFRH